MRSFWYWLAQTAGPAPVMFPVPPRLVSVSLHSLASTGPRICQVQHQSGTQQNPLTPQSPFSQLTAPNPVHCSVNYAGSYATSLAQSSSHFAVVLQVLEPSPELPRVYQMGSQHGWAPTCPTCHFTIRTARFSTESHNQPPGSSTRPKYTCHLDVASWFAACPQTSFPSTHLHPQADSLANPHYSSMKGN